MTKTKKLKTKVVTELKKNNRETIKKYYNKAQKLNLWQILKTQMATQLKNSNCDKAQKLWHNLKTHIATKFQNSNCDKLKYQIVTT